MTCTRGLGHLAQSEFSVSIAAGIGLGTRFEGGLGPALGAYFEARFSRWVSSGLQRRRLCRDRCSRFRYGAIWLRRARAGLLFATADLDARDDQHDADLRERG